MGELILFIIFRIVAELIRLMCGWAYLLIVSLTCMLCEAMLAIVTAPYRLFAD